MVDLTVIPLSKMKTVTSKFVISRTLELQLHTSSSSSNTNITSPSFFPLQRRRHRCPIFSSPSYLRPRTRNSKLVHLSASLSHLSWLSPHHSGSNDYNGWAIVESPPENNNKKKGFSTFVIGVTVGSSFALLLAAICYFSLSRTGFKLQFGSSLNVLNDILKLNERNSDESKTVDSRETDGDNIASPGLKGVFGLGSVDRLERVIVSVATDSTLQESLSILKKLKWIVGFLSFWHRGELRASRIRVLPWHIFLGLYTYGLAVATAETGRLEKLTFLQSRRIISKRCPESMVVNSLGLGLALLSGIVIFVAFSRKFHAHQTKLKYSNSSAFHVDERKEIDRSK